MMEQIFKRFLAIYILIYSVSIANAQAQKNIQGVVFRKGTTVRIGNAKVYNKNPGYSIVTDNLGLFNILASEGDTIKITHDGYLDHEFRVADFKDIFIYLQPSTLLSEVTIRGESVKRGLKEVQDSYRKKGIYYKGKPPIWLLLPFGGSPATFFYELFSKDGKRARRFERYAGGELDYYEVSRRFNNTTIKSIVPISDTDLEEFKSAYWPKAEQLKDWSDFDLLKYIKKSYEEFMKNKNSP